MIDQVDIAVLSKSAKYGYIEMSTCQNIWGHDEQKIWKNANRDLVQRIHIYGNRDCFIGRKTAVKCCSKFIGSKKVWCTRLVQGGAVSVCPAENVLACKPIFFVSLCICVFVYVCLCVFLSFCLFVFFMHFKIGARRSC